MVGKVTKEKRRLISWLGNKIVFHLGMRIDRGTSYVHQKNVLKDSKARNKTAKNEKSILSVRKPY